MPKKVGRPGATSRQAILMAAETLVKDGGEAALGFDDAVHDRRPALRRQIGDPLLLLLGHNKRVARPPRVDVEEGIPLVAVGDLGRRDVAVDDLGEDRH